MCICKLYIDQHFVHQKVSSFSISLSLISLPSPTSRVAAPDSKLKFHRQKKRGIFDKSQLESFHFILNQFWIPDPDWALNITYDKYMYIYSTYILDASIKLSNIISKCLKLVWPLSSSLDYCWEQDGWRFIAGIYWGRETNLCWNNVWNKVYGEEHYFFSFMFVLRIFLQNWFTSRNSWPYDLNQEREKREKERERDP